MSATSTDTNRGSAPLTIVNQTCPCAQLAHRIRPNISRQQVEQATAERMGRESKSESCASEQLETNNNWTLTMMPLPVTRAHTNKQAAGQQANILRSSSLSDFGQLWHVDIGSSEFEMPKTRDKITAILSASTCSWAVDQWADISRHYWGRTHWMLVTDIINSLTLANRVCATYPITRHEPDWPN